MHYCDPLNAVLRRARAELRNDAIKKSRLKMTDYLH